MGNFWLCIWNTWIYGHVVTHFPSLSLSLKSSTANEVTLLWSVSIEFARQRTIVNCDTSSKPQRHNSSSSGGIGSSRHKLARVHNSAHNDQLYSVCWSVGCRSILSTSRHPTSIIHFECLPVFSFPELRCLALCCFEYYLKFHWNSSTMSISLVNSKTWVFFPACVCMRNFRLRFMLLWIQFSLDLMSICLELCIAMHFIVLSCVGLAWPGLPQAQYQPNILRKTMALVLPSPADRLTN